MAIKQERIAIAKSQKYLPNKRNNWSAEEIHKTRKAIASELEVSPKTITLTENTTGGCNIALWGLD